MRWLLLIPFLCLPSLCPVSADEATPVRISGISLPVTPAEETAPVDPQPIATIRPEEWYVVTSDVPLIALTSPDGILRVDHEAGPLRLRGKFAGGNGKVESRSYSEPHIYFVEPLRSGTSELILIPVGVMDSADIVRQVLTVSGVGPNPPPGPGPEPQPVTGHVTIAVVEDVTQRTADTAITLNALAGWNALKDAGHDWRLYDIKTTEPKGVAAVKAASSAGTGLPAMIVSDAESAKILRSLPLPVGIDAVKRVVNELTGGDL